MRRRKKQNWAEKIIFRELYHLTRDEDGCPVVHFNTAQSKRLMRQLEVAEQLIQFHETCIRNLTEEKIETWFRLRRFICDVLDKNDAPEANMEGRQVYVDFNSAQAIVRDIPKKKKGGK